MSKKPHGNPDRPGDHCPTKFDLSDPVTWKYLSLDHETALNIAKGFPGYWKTEFELQGVPLSNAMSRKLAENCRAVGLELLSKAKSPLPNSFQSKLPPMADVFKKIPMKPLINIPLSELLLYDNPFAAFRASLLPFQDSGRAVVSVELWKQLSQEFLDGLTLAESVSYCDEFRPQVGRRGEQLPDGALFRGGSRLADPQRLEDMFAAFPSQVVRWGPLRYKTDSVFDSHFCVVGKPRTGKTTILKLLFQSVFSDLKEPTRFVFYDAKPDLLPCMTPPEDQDDSHASSALPVYLLDPFDQRATAWDIAKDATSRTKSEDIADILFGVGSPDEDYFDAAAPVIATAAMHALNQKAGDHWTLYDLITALRPENVEAVLKSTPYGEQEYNTYFQSPTTSSSDLIKTLANKTKRLRTVAYAWTHAKERLSLTDWVNSNTKSIVLSHNDQYARASKEINRILLNFLTKELLGKEHPPARTFLYLDEFENFGHISNLTRLAHQGASRQVNMALALHNLDTLKKLYGDDTEGILDECAFKAFLSVGNRNTAGWASDAMGTQDVLIEQTSSQSGSSTGQSTRKDDSTKSESEQTGESVTRIAKNRKLVAPDEISRLPMPKTSQAVTGYFLAPDHFPYQGTQPLSRLVCSPREYLDRRDVKQEDNFYALWPKDESVRNSLPLPVDSIDSPDDSFATLHALGFPNPGYRRTGNQPSASQPPPSPPPAQAEERASESAALPDRPKVNLDDLDFGFEFDDE